MSELTVGVLRTAGTRHLEESVAQHAAAVAAAEVRLAVFPELSLTGYRMDAPVVDPRDRRLAPLVAACGEAGTTALVGAPVRHDGGRTIAVLMVTGTGASVVYRKTCLSDDESRHYVAGGEPATVEIDGWRLGLGVCKDTRIEAHLEATAALGIDVYLAGLEHSEGDFAEVERRAEHIVATYAVPVAFSAGAAGLGIWSRDSARLAVTTDPGVDLVTAVLPPR